MVSDTAPRIGRRQTWGAFGLLLVYVVLAPPVFLLGPLAALLLLSRPRTLREWSWIAAAFALAAGTWTVHPAGGAGGDLIGHAVQLGGVVFTVGFVAALLVHPPTRHPVGHALIGVAVATGFLVLLALRVGVHLPEALAALTDMVLAPLAGWNSGGSPEWGPLLQRWREQAPSYARLYPASLGLWAMGGGALAWRWYHRLAAHPLGDAPPPFRSFRFNDHLIWIALGALGTLLLAPGDSLGFWAASLLVLWTGLYVVRGLAVVSAAVHHLPLFPRAALFLSGLLLLPFALGGLAAIGVADTWIDVRAKLAAMRAPHRENDQ